MRITDEILMAYADGALTAEEMTIVEQAMAEDEALAEKVALFADSRTMVKRAHATPPPVSAELEARVRAMAAASTQAPEQPASNVIDLAARRRVVPFWQLPVAASVALAIGLGSAWLLGSATTTGGGGLAIAALDDPALTDALANVPSGTRVMLDNGAEFAAVATFRDGEDTLCREFEHDSAAGATVVAVACREDAGWDVRFAIAAAAADDTGYAPASSLEVLDSYLTSTGAAAPLSAADEAAALSDLE